MGKKVIPVINNKHDIRFVGAEAGHLAGFDKDGKIIDGGTGFELPANPSDGKVLMWSNGELVWGTPFTLPSGGQPGQVLGLDENGNLSWLTVSYTFPYSEIPVSANFESDFDLEITTEAENV